MSTFTRKEATQLSKDIITTLEKAGFSGVNFALKGGSFADGEATFKIQVVKAGAVSQAEKDLAFHAKLDGIDINKVGPKGEKLLEFHARKHRYPYIYVRKSGRKMKASRDQAKRLFGA